MFSFQALKMCILFSIENYRGVVYNAMNVSTALNHQLSPISTWIFSGICVNYILNFQRHNIFDNFKKKQ